MCFLIQSKLAVWYIFYREDPEWDTDVGNPFADSSTSDDPTYAIEPDYRSDL